MTKSPGACATSFNDEEHSLDDVWLQDEFKFGRPRTLWEEGTPHFTFSPNPRPPPSVAEFESRRKNLDSVICTLGHPGDVNLLSTARLMEIGMFIAHTDFTAQDIRIFGAIQMASWDCVIFLQHLMGNNRRPLILSQSMAKLWQTQ